MNELGERRDLKDEDHEARELRQQDAHDRRNERQHLAHPDPRDPDHAGATAPQRIIYGGRLAGKAATLRAMEAANEIARKLAK